MYRIKRTNEYSKYTVDSDSDDDYIEDKQSLKSYPQPRRAMTVVTTRSAPEQRPKRIIKRYVAPRKKELGGDRIMYPSNRCIRSLNLKRSEEAILSSVYYRDNEHSKVKVIRSEPINKRINEACYSFRKKKPANLTYLFRPLRLITRVNSGSGSVAESSTAYSDSIHTKVRTKRFERRIESFPNSSQRPIIPHHIIGKSADNFTKRTRVTEVVSSLKDQTVAKVVGRPDQILQHKIECIPRKQVSDCQKQGSNLTHQTQQVIKNNSGVNFIRPYSELYELNDDVENKGASADKPKSWNRINQKKSFENYSFSRSSESSESVESDGNTTDSSANQHSVMNKTTSARSNPTICLHVDYSKVLKSREKEEPDNIEVKIYYDEDFESIYPKLRKKNPQVSVVDTDFRPPTEIQELKQLTSRKIG
ncbi:unnamed protein product [Mytilus edulis]|uniref:Uncharacterized protein n=1 Tax=Mytilus edulis TaxID=6550 RepID=A0A8S3TMU4_MYTED|nr:unnamed protein product [Mytilus edulis]